MRRHATERHRLRSDERGERPERAREPHERGVEVERDSAARRGRAGGEPWLQVDVADLEPTLGAMRLGVDAPDEMAVVQDRQRVVAVHPLVAGRVDLYAVLEAEQTR